MNNYEALIQETAKNLKASNLKVAVAESLTGGLVAAALIAVPGSSAYFEGGVVAYSNQAKVEFLGVPFQTIINHGAVSRECALAMAQGVKRKMGVAAAVATTGVAGPDGGSPAKPVGTVWLAAAGPKGVEVEKHHFLGDRLEVASASVRHALTLLLRVI